LLAPMREGLAALQATADGTYGKARFSALQPDQQDALLHAIEATEFFETARFLTIAGMFTLPDYGGNREHIGWDLIGFDHRHAWAPPFGYYDADYIQRGE
jgi:gluconate 2-dehydrogenase gamma chain